MPTKSAIFWSNAFKHSTIVIFFTFKKQFSIFIYLKSYLFLWWQNWTFSIITPDFGVTWVGMGTETRYLIGLGAKL